jgi:hypothetical protein
MRDRVRQRAADRRFAGEKVDEAYLDEEVVVS